VANFVPGVVVTTDRSCNTGPTVAIMERVVRGVTPTTRFASIDGFTEKKRELLEIIRDTTHIRPTGTGVSTTGGDASNHNISGTSAALRG
jgi:hypothetical protein